MFEFNPAVPLKFEDFIDHFLYINVSNVKWDCKLKWMKVSGYYRTPKYQNFKVIIKLKIGI